MCLTPCRNFELPWLDDRSRCRIEVPKKHTPHRTCRKWCNSTGHWRPKNSHVAGHLVKKQTSQQTRKTKKRQLLSRSVWHVSPLYHQRAACRAPSRLQHAKEELSCATAEEQNHQLRNYLQVSVVGSAARAFIPLYRAVWPHIWFCLQLQVFHCAMWHQELWAASGMILKKKKGKNWPNLMQGEQLMQASVC